MDVIRPPITVSEYYTCRADCASIYFLKVLLLTPDELMDWKCSEYNYDVLRRQGLEETTSENSIFRIRHMKQWESERLIVERL